MTNHWTMHQCQSTDSVGEASMMINTRPTPCLVNWDFFVICQQKAYKVDRKLSKIRTETAQKTLMDAIRGKNDKILLLHTECVDLFAANAVYQRGCYVKYNSQTPHFASKGQCTPC